MAPHPVIVILGPTASGKTSLSIRLAKKFRGLVISADSRQVYRGMNIGTGKVTKQEMLGVPHFLLDVASPRGQYSVSRYVKDATRIINKADPMKPIFLVGGSPFYIKALTEPNSFSDVLPNQVLRRRLEKKTIAQLIAILKQKNPDRLSTIDQHNRRRLIRAIEIASAKPSALPSLPPMKVLRLGIKIKKSKLHQNIDRRVDVRIRQGMVKEVQSLHDEGISWKKLDSFGLEYRYISRYLRGQITKTEMVQRLKSAIHDFAKRQMTWWKRDQDIHWVTSLAAATKLAQQFLQ